jgi:hypothetical protein
MKVKLNSKQIETIRKGLKETERRSFKADDAFDVFRMLQHWSKCVGGGETKIASLAELPDGYLCRVNSKFRERMKAYLKETRSQRLAEKAEKSRLAKREKEMQENAEKYDQLIKEAGQSKDAD